MTTTCYIGLGSNVGDRLANLRRAVVTLRLVDGVVVDSASSVYETEPVGPEQPKFLNAVVRVSTTLGARELLAELNQIEAELGRVSRERWGPREIDLDILVYGDETIDEPGLVVPHAELSNRSFVLIPLNELAPGLFDVADDPTVVRFALGDALLV